LAEPLESTDTTLYNLAYSLEKLLVVVPSELLPPLLVPVLVVPESLPHEQAIKQRAIKGRKGFHKLSV